MIDITICTNRMHFVGTMAAINSITTNTSRLKDIFFHFAVGADESGELLELIRKCFPSPSFRYEVAEFRSTPFLEDFIRAGQHATYATHESQVMNFARFYLHDIYPDLDKIIYLDSDLIVQADIAELHEIATLAEHPLAAVPIGTLDFWPGIYNRDSVHLQHIDYREPAFNNGVYVTSLAQWQEQGIVEKLEGWIRIHRKSIGDFVFGTQSIMNLVFHRNFEVLPAEWNVRPLGVRDDFTAGELETAKLLHWAGPKKPWKEDGLYKDYWSEYALEAAS